MARRTSRHAGWLATSLATAALLASTPLAAQTGGRQPRHRLRQHRLLRHGRWWALTWRAATGNRGEGQQDQLRAASEWAVAVLSGTSGLWRARASPSTAAC